MSCFPLLIYDKFPNKKVNGGGGIEEEEGGKVEWHKSRPQTSVPPRVQNMSEVFGVECRVPYIAPQT